MKRLLFVICLLACLSGMDAMSQDSLRYHIDLKDKAATEFSLRHPERFLSVKAIQLMKGNTYLYQNFDASGKLLPRSMLKIGF